jgi:hypothetical protein
MSKKTPVDAGPAEGDSALRLTRSVLAAVGWREWVDLPAFGVTRVKAKVDTGARTSTLHAINIHYVSKHGAAYVRFDVHPQQRDTKRILRCEAPLAEERYVTDSGGTRTLRPVIVTELIIGGARFAAELTLISRAEMGFRMLLGRQALKGRFVVDPGRSYLASRTPKKKKAMKKKKKKDNAAKATSETP